MATVAGRLRETAITDLTSVTTGNVINTTDLVDCSYGIAGTFVGTWVVKVSFDGGTTYVTYATGTAPGTGSLPRCGHVRVDCTAFTSGTISGGIGGSDVNRLG